MVRDGVVTKSNRMYINKIGTCMKVLFQTVATLSIANQKDVNSHAAILDHGFFLAHLSTVVVRLSVHNFLANTLASTNINQSAPNLVRMYMTIRYRMSFIMELIRQELSELSALELENLPYLTLLTL